MKNILFAIGLLAGGVFIVLFVATNALVLLIATAAAIALMLYFKFRKRPATKPALDDAQKKMDDFSDESSQEGEARS